MTSSSGEQALRQTLSSLSRTAPTSPDSQALLSRAKNLLLSLDALLPSPSTSPSLLALGRQTLEAGALRSIRVQDPDAFTRYYAQLQPFYEYPWYPRSLEGAKGGGGGRGGGGAGGEEQEERSQRSKITGLYLLLLLTKGDYAGFHSVLEGLEAAAVPSGTKDGDPTGVGAGGGGDAYYANDRFIRYPVRLEQWLMEGAYDRVWEATRNRQPVGDEDDNEDDDGDDEGDNEDANNENSAARAKSIGMPSEEFAVFGDVLVGTIQAEIASCSEKAYSSVPVANAKNLLFLASEGEVVQFARQRGWTVRDGRIYFPDSRQQAQSQEQYRGGEGDGGAKHGGSGASGRADKETLIASEDIIANSIGYARELETIV